jgi:hypothetical protein
VRIASFLEVREGVPVSVHRLEYFEHSVERDDRKVEKKQRPEYIYFHHLKVAAYQTESKRNCGALPYVPFVHTAHQRFIVRTVDVQVQVEIGGVA